MRQANRAATRVSEPSEIQPYEIIMQQNGAITLDWKGELAYSLETNSVKRVASNVVKPKKKASRTEATLEELRANLRAQRSSPRPMPVVPDVPRRFSGGCGSSSGGSSCGSSCGSSSLRPSSGGCGSPSGCG